MDSGISFKRLSLIVGTVFMVGVISPTIVYGSEIAFQAVLSAFQEFSKQLKDLVDGVKKVKEEVNGVKDKLYKNVNYTKIFFPEEMADITPRFIHDYQKLIGLFDDSSKSKEYIHVSREKVGLANSTANNVLELENDVRKAYVVLKDATHENLKNGTVPKQKVTREELARVHQQRGLVLRNAAIKGIALSLEQQKEMYSERSSAIYEEVKEYMNKAESAKDFAHVQTMVMLALWTELRQQRQLIAALLQSQAAKNLHGDPLLVDISPAPRKRTPSPDPKGSNSDKLTSEEKQFFEDLQKMNEEYRRKNPTQNPAR